MINLKGTYRATEKVITTTNAVHELLTSVKFVWTLIFVKGNIFCSPGLDANQNEVPFDHLRDIDSTTVHSSVSSPKFKIQVLPSKDRDLLIVMYLQYIYK